ncbi:MAG: hypothetical protein HYW06_13460 [Gemmatimonadetes bacterium]|nr:hypothetical protein [Gemmatimonadota bacterium]
MSNLAARRVKFVRASLEQLSPTQCLAKVELARAEAGNYVGTATGGCPDVEGLKASAQAAVDALMQAVGKEHLIEVHDVEVFDAFGQSAVLVHLAAQLQDRTQALMGFCVAGGDPARAAALAVLNATNRVLDIG